MQKHIYDKSQPENMDLVRKIRALLNEYPDTMSLAEIGDDNSVKLAAEYSATPDVLHTAYSFALMTNKGSVPPASMFRTKLEEQLAQPGDSWPAWAISNHDVVRAASRWSGSDYGYDPRLSKMLMALLASLRGTPFIYQGEELGLPEANIPFEKILDPWGKYLYPKWKGRDGCRTPMPWDTKAQDGWLPVPDEHRAMSVSAQEKDAHSTLSFTQKFLHWRRNHKALITGDIQFIDAGTENVLLYERNGEGETLLCAFNLSNKPVSLKTFDLKPFEAHFSVGERTLFTSSAT
jgi:alpha-glucosidase